MVATGSPASAASSTLSVARAAACTACAKLLEHLLARHRIHELDRIEQGARSHFHRLEGRHDVQRRNTGVVPIRDRTCVGERAEGQLTQVDWANDPFQLDHCTLLRTVDVASEAARIIPAWISGLTLLRASSVVGYRTPRSSA